MAGGVVVLMLVTSFDALLVKSWEVFKDRKKV